MRHRAKGLRFHEVWEEGNDLQVVRWWCSANRIHEGRNEVDALNQSSFLVAARAVGRGDGSYMIIGIRTDSA